MALIICSECGKKLSDHAEECPHCGCPIEIIKHDQSISDIHSTPATETYNPDVATSSDYSEEKTNSPENLVSESEEYYDEYYDEQPKTKKKGTMIFIVIGSLLILAGIGIYFFTNQSKNQYENASPQTEDTYKIEDNFSKQTEEEQRQKEEHNRTQKEGPDWLQGTWRVGMNDDYGNFIGYIYSTFDHGKLTIKSGDMSFNYTYTVSQDARSIEFANGGKYYLRDGYVLSNNGEQMEKVADLSNNSAHTSYSSSSQQEKELEIMNKLHELGEKGKQMMPLIEQLYRRQQQAQHQGILSNPNAQYDLNDAINKLIDIKNEQIRLAERLGDAQLVKEYKDQRSSIYQAKDQMLYGVR